MDNSMFSFALSILLLSIITTLCFGESILNSNTDKQALVSFKKYIISDPHATLSTNWSENTPFCNWIGVHCGIKQQRVTGLDLFGYDLAGTVPPHIGNLTFLKYLDIRSNNFTGSLPFELSRLRRLESMHIGFNSFAGEIPTWLGSLPRLESLYLDNNNFSGFVPSDMCNNIRKLYLRHNKLQGQIPPNIWKCRINLGELSLAYNNLGGTIPLEIGNMTMLRILSLGDNHFTGFIPNTMGEMSQLQALLLDSNKLIGEIPYSICNLTSLLYLYLSNNSLEGSIPQCLGELSSSLAILSLDENHFHGLIPFPTTFSKGCSLASLSLNLNRLEGTLPHSLVECQNLQFINVANNRLHGGFPLWTQTLADLQALILRSNNFSGTISLMTSNHFLKLQVFDISHNAFSGSLDAPYWKNFKAMMDVQENLRKKQDWSFYYSDSFTFTTKGNEASFKRFLKSFTIINLSSNRFSGTISDSIGDLISLVQLNLSHNCLTGYIPVSLGNVPTLESLDLSWNQLEGRIPIELTKLTFLSKLNLSMNNLSDQIPLAGQFHTFENTSYVGKSGLCGSPLTQKCERGSSPEQEDGESFFVKGFCWEGVVSGYGTGFVMGVSMGYFILRYGRPKWLVDCLYRIYNYKI